MTNYRYKNIPLMPSIASEHIIEFLSKQSQPVKRVAISNYAETTHRTNGGALTTDVEASIKKDLNRLIDEDKVKRPAVGWYQLNSIRTRDGALDAPSEFSASTSIAAEEVVTAEVVIGEGVEIVYVYFLEAERKVAIL